MGSLADVLGALKPDAWYKVTLALACAVLFWSLFTPIVGGVSSIQVQQLALAVVLVSIGEWLNHTTQSAVTHASAGYGGPYVVTREVRRFSFLGTLFILGSLWIGFPAVKDLVNLSRVEKHPVEAPAPDLQRR